MILGFVTRNLRYKLGAFLITFMLWVIVLGSKNVDELKTIPIEIIKPKNLVLVNDLPDAVTVRFAGPKAFLRALLNRDDLISIDLTNAKNGSQLVRIPVEQIKLPLGVRVMSVTPAQFNLRLESLKAKTLPVMLSTMGDLGPGMRLEEVRLEPNNIQVEGPESLIDLLSVLRTEAVDLRSITTSSYRDVSILLPSNKIDLKGVDRVRVRFRLSGGAINNFRVRNLLVTVPSEAKIVSPTSVSVLVQGNMEGLSRELVSQIRIRAKVPSRRVGRMTVPLEADLPPELGLVKIEPPQVIVDVR